METWRGFSGGAISMIDPMSSSPLPLSPLPYHYHHRHHYLHQNLFLGVPQALLLPYGHFLEHEADTVLAFGPHFVVMFSKNLVSRAGGN